MILDLAQFGKTMTTLIFCRRLAQSDVIVMPSVTSMDWSAIQVKNWWKTVHIEEKLDVIRQHEKGEWIFGICWNVRLTHSGIRTICDNADRIKVLSQELKVYVQQDCHSPFGVNCTRNCWCESYMFIALETNKQ
jgi:hypothetical protein